METGSHDRLEEGMLNLGLTNGSSRRPDEEEEEAAGDGCAPMGQVWGPAPGKAAHLPQQEQLQTCWRGGEARCARGTVNEADIEDARNLVAFSASAGAPPPSALPEPQTKTAQLYEKFNQEMGGGGAESGPVGRAAEGERCPPEDLNTLQTALSQARHGHKPPNCNCDGPDCPDYLEWLEKKIKQAADGQEAAATQHPDPQQHPSNPPPQLNGASLPLTSPAPGPHQQPPCTPLSCAPVPCSPAPIPCSPSVLSIAKEKNISLQTAIAIEALTQLSATVPQTVVPPAEAASANHQHHHPPHHLPQPQHGTRLVPSSPSASSPLPQSVPPGLYPQQDPLYWEQHRPQSRAEASAPHAMPLRSSPHPNSASPFPSPLPAAGSPLPKPWQLGAGGSCERASPRNPWMTLKSEPQPHLPPPPSPHSSGDPMSELKQLLGDTSGKYMNPAFRFPAPQHHGHHGLKEKGAGPAVARIKQEVDCGEYPGSACAVMGRYGMVNGQQQQQQQYPGRPLSPGSAAIRHSTQAALQQHLHHKRNLFSSDPTLPHRPPLGFQDLRKWWPQMGGAEASLPIKQEPKKKKSAQGSPSLKQMAGLFPQPGPPLPKPKQIIIKKPKQRASQPIFLPQSQILAQKPPPSRPESAPPLIPAAPALSSAELGPLLPLSSCNLSQADMSCMAPAHSQESISNSAIAPSAAPAVSESAPPASVPLPSSVPPPQSDPDSSGPVGSVEGNSAPSTTPAALPSQSSPSLAGLGSLDPKFEELIRQFEAEFPVPSPQTQAPEQAQTQSAVAESQPNSNSGQASPPAPPMDQPPAPATLPPPAGEEMELEEEGARTAVEGAPASPAPLPGDGVTETPVEQGLDGGVEVQSSQSQLLPLTQEALLQQQQHRVLEDPFTMPFSPLPKRMKLEASGGVAVLSTTTCLSTMPDESETPTKEGPPSDPTLRGFLESPLRYLDTPTKSLLDTPAKEGQAEFPLCDCVEQILEKDEGPYYNHLGSGPTVASIRELMESRYGEKGEAIRIEKVIYTGKEGKSSQGCPIAKWVIRRSSEAEKLLCLVRHRVGHHCANAVIIILILAWEGVPRALGDKLYHELSETLTKFGNPTSRRCALNDDRTCACQGKDPDTCGASFSFGCSWSMYFNGCKYARSKTPRKFRLQGDHPKEEENLRDNFQDLATKVAPLYKRLAPQAYSNQCAMEQTASDCRLGLKEGRPFSGVTACMDFCAHAHKDQHNLYNGCTVVCTLTKEDNRVVGQIPEDEQLHVLPLYKVSLTDEFGSEETQRLKMQNGAIQVLTNFRREVRKLPEPAKSCRQRRLEAKKAASERKKGQKLGETPEKTIKTEVRHSGSPHPQQGNKAIPKQEVKPTIKTEKDGRFPPFNGVLDGYSGLGTHQGTDPYSMNSVYSYPGYYARSGLPSNGPAPAPAPGPVNGFHPNLSALPYGYYNYPPNALFSPQFIGYEGRNGTWPKTAATATSFDKKLDVQSLQASLAHSYPDHPEQPTGERAKHVYTPSCDSAQPHALPPRPQTAPADPTRRATPVIKQEPVDVPLYPDCRAEGALQHHTAESSPAPQHEAWPGHKLNGSLAPDAWESSLKRASSSAQASAFTPDKQQLHQQHLHQRHHHPHPQQHPQQWNSLQGASTPMASPAPSPSPSLKATPSPSPSPHPPANARHWDGPSPSPQPKPWGMGPAGYNPGLKHSGPAGGFPDKLWYKADESRGSTPLGLQEKAWKSCGGSVAGSTPSPAPEGRLFPDAFQQSEAQVCWEPGGAESQMEEQAEREPEEDEVWSDSEHNFLDPNIGGVAVAPAHGSILIECARRELHATTPLKKPNRCHPTRISLVFYQHKNLNQPCHGLALWEAKMKLLAERARQRQQEAALLGLSQDDIKAYGKKRKWSAAAGGANPGPGQGKDKREGVVTRLAPAQHTTSVVTASPYAFTQLTGPYSRWV
ncbi:hypothetical protein MATL_G00061690 [Megalops atlanticus]|uniref:Methylcytosine dioxygenase TET n=1 Tax=Megalops atlanticus TaxID=7932 RepID=A0A9D3Q8R4_MEGAT|nr:hypothetical protein MATL_G00061690 [Megalops atlanticus]